MNGEINNEFIYELPELLVIGFGTFCAGDTVEIPTGEEDENPDPLA